MSTEVYGHDNWQASVYVTRVVAPASDGEDRLRWEFFAPNPVRLTRADVHALIANLRDSLAPVRT